MQNSDHMTRKKYFLSAKFTSSNITNNFTEKI